ncbi:DUF4442 domain-containing protein [Crenobacter caeni]|uniref:DUF4442 domain-containing protein n=1 Tax=Crenobacter caeni TaxID=2705474 RepID=A0A6B2KQD6_9NEIS|nr:DUF4442 domain-containing protein [Crenobacter caeni]NDV12456.1 DUF4442 domain-containing protein [Crenobacter caeni]
MALVQNRMSRIAGKTRALPAPLRSMVLSRVFGRVVPFLSTAGVRFEEVGSHRLAVSIANRRRAQNHIRGVHAAAMALLAETATGFVVGMNMPDDKLMLLKSMHVDYLKRSQGAMRAVATLRDDDIVRFHHEERGEIKVPVTVTDESGQAPIECTMVWAWLPKKKEQK